MKIALRSLAGLSIALAVAVAALVTVVALNLRTYSRLTYEQPVAEISFQAKSARHYLARLTRPDHEAQTFELLGDEWQVDARVLKWHGWANVLGLDARYRLERLSGRYLEIERERAGPRSVYEIGETPAVDLWALAKSHPRFVGWLFDGYYGSATFLPMAEGATYQVALTQSGLVARPANEIAKVAVQSWR